MTHYTNSYPPLVQGYFRRLAVLFLFVFAGLVVASIAMGLLSAGGMNTPRLRIATVIQDLLVFIVPALLAASMFSSRPDRLLETDRGFSPLLLVLALIILMASLPAMNWLVEWNESLSLPSSMSGLEEWMKSSEESARQSVKTLLGGSTAWDLVVSMLIVAVLAGFSEEIFFRGALQRLLGSGGMNRHLAIWVTALIFSAFHMQFYGFFPRLLLGALFGYLLYWSGSLWLPVAVHTFNNALVVFATWYAGINPESGISKVDTVGTSSPGMVIGSIIATAFAIKVFLTVTKKSRPGDEA